MDAAETREDAEVEVFSTPTPFEAEQVALALGDAGLPVQRRLWAGGIEQASSDFNQFFPGGFCIIRVPAPVADHARAIVHDLGFQSEPAGIWSTPAPLNVRGRIQTYALLGLILAILAAFGRCFG